MKLNIVLTENQWKRISEILNNIGLLTMGSTVVPSLRGEYNISLAILGIVISTLFWYGSVATAKKY